MAALDKAHGLRSRTARPLYRARLGRDERDQLRPFFLLTNKPVLAVVNLGEDAAGDEASLHQAGRRRARRARPRCWGSA